MNVTNLKVLKQWAYARPLLACVYAPNGKSVFTSSEDHQLQRWNLTDEKPALLKGHESWVYALAVSLDGGFLLSGGCDGKLIWWPIEGNEPVRVVEAHAGWIRSLVVLPDGRIATGGNDRFIRLWDPRDGAKLGEWQGHEKQIYSLAVTKDPNQLIAGDLGGKIHLWNLTTKAIERSFDGATLYSYNGGQQVDFGGVRSLTLRADGKELVAGGLHKASNPLGAVHEPLVLRFDWDSGKLLKSHVTEKITGGIASRCLYLKDGTVCGVSGGSSGGWLLFWNAEKEGTFHQLQLPGLARDMALHPEGNQFATVHYDRHLRIVGEPT